MRLEKLRHIIILKALLETDVPLTAASLASLCRSSLRTVKNDIAYLNSLCVKENIMEIRSLKAKGYLITVKDSDRYMNLCDDVEVLHSLFYGKSVEGVNRRMYILQRFLSDDHVKIEDLSEKLYISRSSIRKDVAWTRRFLNSYHINLLSDADGYRIQGKEQDLRSAMVELRCSQYHEFKPLYPYETFDRMFEKDGVNHYSELRKAFLNVLRSSRIVVSDIETKKITSHLCLIINRMKKGCSPQLDDVMIGELKDSYDYEVAKEIFADPVIAAYVKASDLEILNFARLLLINRDLNLRVSGDGDLPKELVRENREVLNEIISDMDDYQGYKLFHTEFFRIYLRDLESLQLQLYLKHHFDHTGKMRFITYLEGDENLFSPVPLELTRAMIARLQKKLNEPIIDAIVRSYAGVFERILKKVVYPYHKQRLAVTTTEGLVYSQHVAESLLELFPNYIEKADVFNLYEMRKVNFDDYDAIIHSGFVLYYNYPLPLVAYRELDYSQMAGDLYDNLLRFGFERSELERVKKTINIYEDEKIRDISAFVESLSYRYGKDRTSQQLIYTLYCENEKIIEHYYSRNGIVLIFMPYSLTDREIIDVYLPEQNVYYEENSDVNAVIAVCVNPDMSLADLKIFDHILRYIVQVPGTLENLIEDRDVTLDTIFDIIIKRKFLSS